MSDNRTIPVDRRSFLRATGATATAVGLAGCRGSGGNSGAFQIGVLGQMANPVGESIKLGAQVARDELNNNGGINDRDVELVTANTEGNGSTGSSVYQDLVLEQQVDMTTGVFSSEVLMSILGNIAEAQTIHMTTGAATPRASSEVANSYSEYKYHFRTGPLNALQLGQNLADFALDMFPEMGWESVALLLEDREWTTAVESVVGETLQQSDINVVMKERFPDDTSNYGTIYSSVESNGADGAFVAMAHTGGNAVNAWANRESQFGFAGVHVPGQLPAFYQASMGNAAYTVTQNVATPQSTLTDKTQPFVEAYESKHNKLPAFTGYITYDAIHQYADTVANMDGDPANTDDVVTALEQSSYTGSIGTIEYHGEGHEYCHDVIYDQSKVNPVFQQWSTDGTQEVIFPEDQKTADYQQPEWIQ